MKSTLTVGELYSLDKELTGIIDPKTGATWKQGLLTQDISGEDKYDLLDFYEETILSNKRIVDKMHDELIKKLGVEGENGSFNIPPFIDKNEEGSEEISQIENPALVEFNKELEEILSKDKEFTHPAFKKSILSFKSKEVYPIFNKLLRLIKKQQESAK